MMIASFFWYVGQGILSVIALAILLSPVVFVLWLGRMYWKHLHEDPVHIDPWVIFEKDAVLVGKIVAVIVGILLFLALMGYLSSYMDKRLDERKSNSENSYTINTVESVT